ncbi:hypothetical protein ACN2MM_05990 [Alkalilimnicola ehrlichii MLHE-1]|uniref:Uncharacterized protein n=1 Tax=Alkalilimnicola ehrlichii (strain ATCC BAA-1101 / DSM 17681 / MLHE-1) TaxID=187272 RepID=Q0A9R7_ALKEH|nr:hypothetical protein [Alkalilimnicola ehrlichii]ABI56420.1 hypothetical protein Mlg_1068 [Alkalilimnicola ehrlichii MLHE-1]
MGKHVDALEKQIAEEYRLNEEHAAAADKARDEYQAAVAAGDMGAASNCRAEAERLDGLARQHGDRIDALEAQRPEAERKDNGPAFRQAVKVMEQELQEEADTHAELAELVGKLADLRKRLDEVHASATAACRKAFQAADAAHEPRPEVDRDRMATTADMDALMRTVRELMNVAGHQATLVMNTRDKARAA